MAGVDGKPGEYRKRPVIVEAVQFTADNWTEVRSFVGDAFIRNSTIQNGGIASFRLRTPEGAMTATRGDWIIRGVKGEVYACKPDIFAATYEAVA